MQPCFPPYLLLFELLQGVKDQGGDKEEEEMEEEVREQSTGPRREGKATGGQGSTYSSCRAVRVDQLPGRMPLREGFLDIHLQKGDHGRERREGSRARVRGQTKGKKGKEKKSSRAGKECKGSAGGAFCIAMAPSGVHIQKEGAYRAGRRGR